MLTTNIVKVICILFCGFFFVQTSFSQNNYLPGYVINTKRDTIQGFIDYKNWEKNPSIISFKDKIASNAKKYTPIDISEFSVQNEIYVSAVVKTEVSPSRTNSLQLNSPFNFKEETTFLQAKILGEKSLYYLKNKDGKDNFYINIDDEFILLEYKKYLKNIDGKKLVAERKKYIGQLAHYLQDCPSIHSKLKNIKYAQSSLNKLFLEYYKCVNSEVKFHKKTEKITTEFGVVAGISQTSIDFYSEDFFAYLSEVNFGTSTDIAAGLFVNLIFPRNDKRWSLYNELIFNSYKFNGQYEDIEYEEWYDNYYTELEYTYLKLNNMIRYSFPVGDIFIYLNTGISNGFVINEVNYLKKDHKFFSNEETSIRTAISDTRKYEQGFLIGSGLKFKSYSFELRYESGTGISNLLTLSSSTKRIYFLLGYTF